MLAERAQGLPALNERLRQRREVRDPGLLTQLAKEFAVEQYQYRHGVPGDVWDPEGFDPRLSLAGLIEVRGRAVVGLCLVGLGSAAG